MEQGARDSKNKKFALRLGVFTVVMFGFAYALVPLYNLMCEAWGINGKPSNEAVTRVATAIDKTRDITVQFTSVRNEELPWVFRPETKVIHIHPGEYKRTSYFAENISGHTMTVQAIPSVVPAEAAKYFRKTECFCFNKQTLASGTKLDMPLLFHVDVDLPKEIESITLSYTLFDAGKFVKQPSKGA